jgi:DNA-binding transcriptional MocR family regulator
MTSLTGSTIRQMLEVATRPGMISFAGGLPPVEAFDLEGIRTAVIEALQRHPADCLQYGTTSGARPLREALCELMSGRGMPLDPGGLMVTTGSQQAIALIGEAVLNPRDIVALERPSYPASIGMARLRQAGIITAACDSDGIDVAELECRIRRAQPKLLYLVPTFGNPSGAVLSLDRRVRILELAVRYGFLILEDDPYSELYFDTPPPPPLISLARHIPAAAQHCAYCSTLSKIVAPGFRVGWLVAPPEILRAAEVIKQGQDAHTSTLAQHAAIAYLQSGRLARHLPRLRALYRGRAEAMMAAIETHMGGSLDYAAPQGGMFLWARLCSQIHAGLLFEAALQRDVAFLPGESFMAESPDPSTMRLSYAAPDAVHIQEGIARMAAALKGILQC